MPPLLQETVETGPPVEVQVRVNTGGSVTGPVSNWKVISPGIVTCPVGNIEMILSFVSPEAPDKADTTFSSIH